MKDRIISFTVRGKGFFPADMLRYDHCWPARPEDVDRIFLGSEDTKPMRSVKLNTYQREPTEGRWNSFGWRIEEIN